MLILVLVVKNSSDFAARTDDTYLLRNEKLIEPSDSINDKQYQDALKLRENSLLKVHVMFLFASPIVMNYGKNEGPSQLDYRAEFKMIQHSLSKIGRQVRYCKKVATPKTFGEMFIYNPLVLHFSGHGKLGNKDSKFEVLIVL